MPHGRSRVLPAGAIFALAAFLLGLTAGRELSGAWLEVATPAACSAVLAFAGVRMISDRLGVTRTLPDDAPESRLESRFERHVAGRPSGPHRRGVRHRRMIV